MLLFTLTFISILKLFTSYSLTNLQPNQLFTVAGRNTYDYFGRMVKNAGDVNGDGFEDIIIGAFNANGGTGAAYVIYGRKDFSNIDLSIETLDPASTGFHILGNAGGDLFGAAVSGAGDINNDGYDDIIIGAYPKGIVYVIYGNPNAKLSNIDLKTQTLDPATTGFTITGGIPGDPFGYSVGSARNFNGDDYDDIIIGNTKGSGAAYIIYGKPTSSFTNLVFATSSSLPAIIGFQITGSGISGMFGGSVGFAGDVNADGLSDVIIGSDSLNSYRGAAYVIYGKQGSSFANLNLGSVTLDPASTGFQILGKEQNGYFGRGTRAAGDVNGDGIDDIIVGASGNLGAVYVIYGKPTANIDLSSYTLDPQSTGFVVKGSSSARNLGYSCDAADIDKDGYSDIIISSSLANNNQGLLYVVYGKPKDKLANIDLGVDVLDPKMTGFTVSGMAAQDYFGHSVSAAGDFDGDGKPDIAVGAYGRSSSRGAAYVISPSKICLNNCDECRYPSRCKICSRGFKLLDDFTCEICPESTYPVENACKDCPKGCVQCTSQSVCQVCDDGYTLLDSLSCIDKKQNVPQATNAAAGLEGTSAFGSFLSPGSSLPLYFTLSAKLIRNTRYLAVHVSNKLQIERFGWKASSGMLSAPSSWSEKSESRILPQVFIQYGVESAFLINYWKPLIMSLIGLGLFTVFKLIEILVQKEKKLYYKAARSLSIMASNFALTQFYTNLDDVFFFFVLDARSATLDVTFGIISYALAILLVILVIMTLGFHIAFLHKYQNVKHHKRPFEFDVFVEKSENVSLLFRDLKDESLVQQIFLFLHVTRGILANVVTATLFEYPMLQTCLLTLFSICIVVYLLIKRPFKHLNVLCGQYFSEAILLIVNLGMLIMAAFDQNSSGSTNAINTFSNVIYVLNYVLFYGAMGFMALETLKSFYNAFRNQKKFSNSLEAQGKTIFRPRELGASDVVKNNNSLEAYQTSEILKEDLSVADYSQKSPPQAPLKSRNQHNTANLNHAPSLNDSLSTNVSPQIHPTTNRLRSQTMPYHLRNNPDLESKNFDDSLDTSNAELISNSLIRGHSKTISHAQARRKIKMPTGIFQPRRNLEQYISTNGDSSILQITEENLRAQKETSQISLGNSNLRQRRTQGYKEFLRQNMKTKFTNKNSFKR